MPATRRNNPSSSTRAQPTLSFKNKITKPASQSISTKNANAKAYKLEHAVEVSTLLPGPEEVDAPIVEDPTTAELAIRSQVEAQKKQKTAAEDRALKITDIEIKRYWKKKEEERKAPRVHQQGLTMEDKILREFDLSYQFGPCIGIARTKRWKRAENLGLDPPIEVLAVLLKKDARDSAAVQRAYIDDLISSKLITN